METFEDALAEAIRLAPDAYTDNELRKLLPRPAADLGDPDGYIPEGAGKTDG